MMLCLRPFMMRRSIHKFFKNNQAVGSTTKSTVASS